MREIPQDGVNARIFTLEEAGISAWPARETMTVAGWLLRFTDGYTHRGNSVATHRFDDATCEDAVAMSHERALSPNGERLIL